MTPDTPRLGPETLLASAELAREPRDRCTVCVDLSRYRGQSILLKFRLRADAGADPENDRPYLAEATVVGTADLAHDPLPDAPMASWQSELGSVRLGESVTGGAMVQTRTSAPASDSQVYGGGVLETRLGAADDAFIEGRFPVTLPRTPAVLRGELCFADGTPFTDSGVRVSVRFIPDPDRRPGGDRVVPTIPDLLPPVPGEPTSGTDGSVASREAPLLRPHEHPHAALHTRLKAWDAEGGRLPATLVTIPIPEALRGLRGRLCVRLEKGDGLTNGAVIWSALRLTHY